MSTPADDLLAAIRVSGRIPVHIAVIMDGNGRWAQARDLPRPAGHQAGMTAVRQIVEAGLEAGVQVLTLFAFSQENWQRPQEEIDALMLLLEEYIARETADLARQGVQVHILGDLERLSPGARRAVERLTAATAAGRQLVLNLCISYGARAELTRAARLLAEEVARGRLLPSDIDEGAVAARLYTAPWPDP
ncbi:MAG: polyprenyl diphosphate synthase, partial [Gemmatimonadota bacterium]|nr:polyprenyl diphosphate synthase [Gemmatimonadota bacterium]